VGTERSVEISTESSSSKPQLFSWRQRYLTYHKKNSFPFCLSVSLSVAPQPNSRVRNLIVKVCRSHSWTLTTHRTPLNQWSARRRGHYLHNTQQTKETNIYALSKTGTRFSSYQAAASLRIRWHDHKGRL